MTSNQPIECKAAVAWKANEPLSIEIVTVEAPKKGEVRVKILFTAVCHTDQYTLGGSDPEAAFPCILGHEGAGVVESVGEGVVDLKAGDFVVPLYIPQCRECKFCKHPKTNLCSKIRATQGKGLMPDGTSRFTCKGQTIFHYMGTSTFSEYTVLPEISLAKFDGQSAAADKVCLLGCGLSTGFGAALNTADVQEGDTVAIFGLGAVGLAVAVGAKYRKASRIIGVDINDDKESISRELGITDFVNPRKFDKPIEQVLIEMTDGGLDHTFECIGNVKVMESALAAAHRGWGQSIIIGVAGSGEKVSTRPFQMITGRSWKGCAFGNWKSRDSVGKLVDFYMNGHLPVDKFITHTRDGIDKLNEVFDLLNSGKSLRCVIKY